MKFYCPNCQKEYDVEPKETITTQSQRVAYKANCLVCGQDMAEFNPEQTPGMQPAEIPQAQSTETNLTKNESAATPVTEEETPAATTVTNDDPIIDAAQAELNKAASALEQDPVELEPKNDTSTIAETTSKTSTSM